MSLDPGRPRSKLPAGIGPAPCQPIRRCAERRRRLLALRPKEDRMAAETFRFSGDTGTMTLLADLGQGVELFLDFFDTSGTELATPQHGGPQVLERTVAV